MSPSSEIVRIARCPEHGLHGEREECFVCGQGVEQVEMVPATWHGLMAILDRYYPEAVFTGESGNLGAQVIVLTRKLGEALDALKTTDSWLWNKVVNDRYGPVVDSKDELP